MTRHKDRIIDTITGFDRMLFLGTLRCISHCQGMWVFLSSQHVLLKDYGKFVQRLSHEISEHGKAFAAQLGRPYQYLTSSSLSKEQQAREIMERDHIKRGLVCVFAAVEPCHTISVPESAEQKTGTGLAVAPLQALMRHLRISVIVGSDSGTIVSRRFG